MGDIFNSNTCASSNTNNKIFKNGKAFKIKYYDNLKQIDF